MQINKDTALYGSFSQTPGNLGAKRFNRAFELNGINAIYKPFAVKDFGRAFDGAKTLGFKGLAISMPFKTEAYHYCLGVFGEAQKIKNINSMALRDTGEVYGYNTDYQGIKEYIENDFSDNKICCHVNILGTGAYAKTAAHVFKDLGFLVTFIPRLVFEKNPMILRSYSNQIIFNATPMKNLKNIIDGPFIDCNTESESGRKMSFYSAREQFYSVYGFDRNCIFEEVD